MRKDFRKIILCLTIVLCLLSVSGISAQPNEPAIDTVSGLLGIEIQTSVDRAEIYIGDLITYKIIILYDSTYELIPPPLGANLGAFDVKDYQSDIITRLDDGRIMSENIFKLSTFTTGDYVIPPIPVIFNLPNGAKKALLSESIPIKVNSILGTVDDSTDIKPLKAQFEFERDLTFYYIWGSVGFLLLLLVAILIWRRMRRKQEAVEPVDLRPPWEIAFEKLALLKQKNLPEENLFKLYYLELTEIIRAYYEKIYDLNVLDMTTEEFLEAFSEKETPETVYDRSSKLLKHADLVKFAKLKPELSRVEFDFNEIHELIEIVRIDYERRQRIEVSPGIKSSVVENDRPVEEVKS